MDGYVEAVDGAYDEEEYEIEELVDDAPMRIVDHIYLGSLDAARNTAALIASNIREVVGLLGQEEMVCVMPTLVPTEDCIRRKQIVMEDSLNEPLLVRLPSLLATLEDAVKRAEENQTNVLVHCIAGRSRSPSLVAAWMMTKLGFSLRAAIDHITMIRPWIELNKRFQSDLAFFERVLTYDLTGSPLDFSLLENASSLPRLDFGASLIDAIVSHSKTVTMRLPSDADNDPNSDLNNIFAHAIVIATTARDSTHHVPVGYLRIDRVDRATSLQDMNQNTVQRSGFSKRDEVLSVLSQFYPGITSETPLVTIQFTWLGAVCT